MKDLAGDTIGMKENEKLVFEYLKKTYPDLQIIKRLPAWLRKEFWRPTFLIKLRKTKKVVAVDVLLSGEIPKYQYIKVVGKLLNEHNDLRVIIVTFEESYENNPVIEEFCRAHDLGLKIIIPGAGLQTVIRVDVDPRVVTGKVTHEEGWFPSSILAQVNNLSNLAFADIIEEFTDKVTKLGDDKNATQDLVFDTINKLVSKHSSFSNSFRQFLQLARFEEMLRLLPKDGSDHVLHSFRVFLAGCPIVNRFYDNFKEAHECFCIGQNFDICVEYAWFLTAIFHDIGRTKETAAGVVKMLREELQDEDLEFIVSGKITRWTRRPYIEARRVLGSLAAFTAGSAISDSWDGGTIEDEEGERISTIWVNIYNQLRSHAIISAFDFLADLFKKARAANERRFRPFVITHAAPAALSILLHDWRMWQQAKDWRLFPINATKLPMAAILIYIDTWDDYKRKEGESLIHIKDYKVDSRGARVIIEWGDSSLLESHRIQYTEFEKALTERPFSLTIKVIMTDTV